MGGGGEPQQRPAPASRFPCAPLRKLAAMGALVGAFTANEPCMTWEDAAEFFSAALGRPVAGRVAVANAATKLESKLVANSKTKAALKTTLEVMSAAGATLSMADRGEMLAAQGIPSATPSPAAKARSAAKRKERAGRQPPEQLDGAPSEGGDDEDEGESQGSDSYGSEDDDEADDPAPPVTAPQAPRQEARAAEVRGTTAAGASSGSSRKKKKSVRHSGGVGSPETDLARLTPAGWKASQVARVLFSDPLLSEAATYAARPQEDSDSDPDDVAQQRVAFAVRRLKDVSGGDWIPKEQVSSKKALQQVREKVFHLVARGPGHKRDSSQGQPQAAYPIVPAESPSTPRGRRRRRARAHTFYLLSATRRYVRLLFLFVPVRTAARLLVLVPVRATYRTACKCLRRCATRGVCRIGLEQAFACYSAQERGGCASFLCHSRPPRKGSTCVGS